MSQSESLPSGDIGHDVVNWSVHKHRHHGTRGLDRYTRGSVLPYGATY